MSSSRVSTRLVLVGVTGAGKSSSGNTILGRKAFRVAKSSSSVTKECSKQTEDMAGREITIVDTPGMFDTDVSEEALLKEKIGKCITMTTPGPHAIILVIKLGPFTEAERLSVQKIRAIFGKEADKHTIVLFTHGDRLTTTSIDERIQEGGKDLKKILSLCGGRYHVFNNKEMEDRNQVIDFLEKVDKMIAANDNKYFTSDAYNDLEKILKRKETQLRQKFEKKFKEIQKELETRFSTEEEQDKRLKEFKRYYEAKLREIRQEAQQGQVYECVHKKIVDEIELVHIKYTGKNIAELLN